MGNRPTRNDSRTEGGAAQADVAAQQRPVGDTQQFMTTFFQQNEDLGLFGLIAPVTHPNHRRIKAHANKTKALDIPFDIVQGTLTVENMSKSAPIWQFSFKYDSTEELKSTVWLDPVEKRTSDEYKSVEEIASESCLPNVQFGQSGKGCKLVHTLETDFDLWMAAHDKAEAKEEAQRQTACMLLVVLESREAGTAHRKAITKVYLYYRVDKLANPLQNTPPAAFVLEKKGILYGRRFLWLKNIYDHTSATAESAPSGTRGSAGSSEDRLCTVCYTNPTDTVVIPCRHFCLCMHCSKELKRRFHK